MPELITPDRRFRDDDGAPEPALAVALTAYAAGRESEHSVLTALALARLLVPVIPMVTGVTADDQAKTHGGRLPRREKSSEMTVPLLTGRDGRHAIIAFTGMDSLRRWRRDARPLPAAAGEVCEAARAEAAAAVVDVAGPLPLVVEGARLVALATGRPVPRPADDPDVLTVVDEFVAGDPAIASAVLMNGATREEAAAGSGETDLCVRLVLANSAGAAAQREAAARFAASEAMTALARRFRRGIQIAVVPGPPP